MGQPEPRQTASIRYVPSRRSAVLMKSIAVTCGLLVALGLVGLFAWPRRWISIVVLCVAPLLGSWAAYRVVMHRRLRDRAPMWLLRQRRYGDLSAVSADDGRPLRPIGLAIGDVAARTDALLATLTTIPSVRIFQGVWPEGEPRPVAMHAVSAGKLVVLIESVAWPPGRYRMDATGQVRCDGQYIGQSTHALNAAARNCKLLLPRFHQVSALVVVHRTGAGDYDLPAPARDLAWVLADQLPDELATRLTRYASTVSRHTVAVLTGGVPAQEPDP